MAYSWINMQHIFFVRLGFPQSYFRFLEITSFFLLLMADVEPKKIANEVSIYSNLLWFRGRLLRSGRNSFDKAQNFDRRPIPSSVSIALSFNNFGSLCEYFG